MLKWRPELRCSKGHASVKFDQIVCPVCWEMSKKDDRIKELEEKITDLESLTDNKGIGN